MLLNLAIFLGVISPVLYILDSYLPHLYVFSPSRLQEISQTAISTHSNNVTALLDQIVVDLRSEYGDAINPIASSDWFFNNAGGAMGSMIILHASISEYLIFFGTPLGTEVILAFTWLTIISLFWRASNRRRIQESLKQRVYKPGMQNHLRRGEGIQYVMPAGGCWALELAQGGFLVCFHLALETLFSSTLDFGNLEDRKNDGLGYGPTGFERKVLSLMECGGIKTESNATKILRHLNITINGLDFAL